MLGNTMFRWLLLPVGVIVIIIAVLNVYLQPNDLVGCGKTPSLDTDKCRPADVVVAVSGGDTSARTNRAIELYKQGWAKKIIFSGAAADKSGPSNAQAMKLQAVQQSIPVDDILMDEYSKNTTENAANTSKIFQSKNINSVLLVTSGYHQRRASLEFKRNAPHVKVYNAPVLSDRNWGMFWWVNPYNWYLAGTESLKIFLFYVAVGKLV